MNNVKVEKGGYNKGILVGYFLGLALVIGLGLLVFFKGEAMLFAITNEGQVMEEKGRWDAHIKSYGKVVEVGKE